MTSPALIPSKVADTLSFTDAIGEVLAGRKVRRVSWPDEFEYVHLRPFSDGHMLVIQTTGSRQASGINLFEPDLTADDWVLVRDN